MSQLLYSSVNCTNCRNAPLGDYFTLRRLLIGLTRRADVLPDQLYVCDATCSNRDVVTNEVFGDILRGTYQGAEVAMRRLRLTMSDRNSWEASTVDTVPFLKAYLSFQ